MVLRDLDYGLVRSVGITPANLPEAQVTGQLAADLAAQHASLAELHIDPAYPSSTLVRNRDEDLQSFCKAFPVRNGPRFTKAAVGLDFDRGTLSCPAGVAMPLPGRQGAGSCRDLRRLPAAGPMHDQHSRAQRAAPPR